MDGNEYAREVQHRRQNGAQGDLAVGDVHILRHEEGRRAHDGGHYLAAGGGGRLDSAGKLRLVAGLFHHRDRDGAGGDGVADGGAGHHAAQRRGNDGDLCRAAGEAADEGVGKVDEECGDAGALKEGTEDDEHDDVLRADLHGGGHDAAGGVEKGVEQALEAEAGGEGVDKQHTGYTQDGHADAAAAQLHQHKDADNADDDLKIRHLRGAGEHADKRVIAEAIVEEAGRANYHQHEIVPGDVVVTHVVLAGGVGEIAHYHDQTQKSRQALFKRGDGEQGGINAVKREDDHDRAHDDGDLALPYARVRLPVILAHELFHVLRRAHIDILNVCRRVHNVLGKALMLLFVGHS